MITCLNAYKQNIITNMKAAGQWQTAIFFYSIDPGIWLALKAWMESNLIEWRSPDAEVSTYFEYRFEGQK